MIVFPTKPAEATEKFAFDFTEALNGAAITGSPTLTETGVTLDSSEVSGSLVELVLSGGTEGTVATVECTVTTDAGETLYALGVLPIGGEAVDLAAAKTSQRIEGDDEDALLAGFLRAAIDYVERRSGKNLTEKVEMQTVDGFCGRIRLWKGPVSSILSVAYDDDQGVEQTFTDYRFVGSEQLLLPAYNKSWPTYRRASGSVRISYIAGYKPEEVPAQLLQAALLLFGHFNANREAVIASDRAAAVELPLGVEALVAPCSPPLVAS